MLIKLLLCGIIIGFCIFLGWLAAVKYRNRRKFFAQFSTFNERYLGELGYARRNLATAIREYGGEGDFGTLLKEHAIERQPKRRYGYLTEEEQKYCAEYFSMLGRGDAHSQTAYFSAQAGRLSSLRAESESECKKRGELYLKLGLLAGLAFVILIV